MKRTLTITLAIIMLASALAGCSGTPAQSAAISPRITLTSSDAANAAAWLTERLGDALTERVVIGTSSDGYGADVSALEDDGFFIRSFGREDVLFAKTADGLDRAVRRYAKRVEAGESVTDETYHEGYRIEDLRFAGVPVAEYAIAVEGENAYVRDWVTANAAKPFAELVKIACGAEISVGGEAKRKIIFRQIADENWKESSYHYYFEDGDLVFEYTDLGGARNAFVKFLENECGWNDLYYGFDELAEADLVDVPAETDVLCHPRFGGIRHTAGSPSGAPRTLSWVNSVAYGYGFRIGSASHYIGRVWGRDYGVDATGHMPCLTDDGVFEDILAEISSSSERTVAAGGVIGDDFLYINIGMEDSAYWCECKNCSKICKAEGYTHAGEMVYFANRLDAAMDELGFEGLRYSMFAYAGSNRPPRTAPSDDIYITFVFDGSCTNHCLDGSQCESKLPKTYQNGYVLRNMGSWLADWCKLAKHVYARPAPLSTPLHGPALIDQVYDDVVFFTGIGVECVYEEIFTSGEFDTSLVATELWESMMFDPGMTRAEYYEEVARLFEKYYGDGWRGVLDYVDCLERTELEAPRCWTAWHTYQFISDPEQFDHSTYRALWDRMLDSLAAAQREANSREQEKRIEKLRVTAIYNGCYASYYYAYQEHDDARLALLEERWAELVALAKDVGAYEQLKKNGCALYEIADNVYPDGDLIFDTCEQTAWRGAWKTGFWKDYDVFMALGGYDKADWRPMPEKYANAE